MPDYGDRSGRRLGGRPGKPATQMAEEGLRGTGLAPGAVEAMNGQEGKEGKESKEGEDRETPCSETRSRQGHKRHDVRKEIHQRAVQGNRRSRKILEGRPRQKGQDQSEVGVWGSRRPLAHEPERR